MVAAEKPAVPGQRLGLRLGLPAILAIGGLIAFLAQPRAQLAGSEDAAVRAVDAKLNNSMRAGDKSIARRLLSLEFRFVDENGKVHSRKEFLKALKTMAPSAPSDVKVSVHGLVATVTGHHVSADGKDVFFLDIWTKTKHAWHVLNAQDTIIAATASEEQPSTVTSEPGNTRDELAANADCKNPCATIPYRVRSSAEQDVVTAYQSLEKAMMAHNVEAYGRYLSDNYMYYRSGLSPVTKEDRISHIEDKDTPSVAALTTAVHSMRLGVYGNSAVMISTQGAADDGGPLLRISRVWVKRNGHWQLVMGMQTDVTPTVAER